MLFFIEHGTFCVKVHNMVWSKSYMPEQNEIAFLLIFLTDVVIVLVLISSFIRFITIFQQFNWKWHFHQIRLDFSNFSLWDSWDSLETRETHERLMRLVRLILRLIWDLLWDSFETHFEIHLRFIWDSWETHLRLILSGISWSRTSIYGVFFTWNHISRSCLLNFRTVLIPEFWGIFDSGKMWMKKKVKL